jgi:hypothetical protein
MNSDELRIKCAEAMGWNNIAIKDPWSKGQWVTSDLYGECPGKLALIQIPEYDTSLDAAFTLVEALRKEGWLVEIHTAMNDWAICVWPEGRTKYAVITRNPSLCLAICEAFLKAKSTPALAPT